MAALIREGDTLVLQLTPMEKVEGIHGDLRVPVSAVRSVAILENAVRAVHGLKLPSTYIPGILAIGTFLSSEEKIFAMVHYKTQRGIKLSLTGMLFDAWIVGVEDPERVVRTLDLGPDWSDPQ